MPSFIIKFFLGKFILRCNNHVINKWNSAYPVTMTYFAITLNIVLPPNKVPEEIPPIHEFKLITPEKRKVLSKGWLLISFYTSPFFVPMDMIRFTVKHTWKIGAIFRIINRNLFLPD